MSIKENNSQEERYIVTKKTYSLIKNEKMDTLLLFHCPTIRYKWITNNLKINYMVNLHNHIPGEKSKLPLS